MLVIESQTSLVVENQLKLLSMQSLSKVTIGGLVILNTSNLTSPMFFADQSELVVTSMRINSTDSTTTLFDILSESQLNASTLYISNYRGQLFNIQDSVAEISNSLIENILFGQHTGSIIRAQTATLVFKNFTIGKTCL
jgi:hypothetical protein